MSLTDEERLELKDKFLEDIKEQHSQQLEMQKEFASRQQAKNRQNPFEREAEIAALRIQVRNEYYRSIGYVEYTDSRGLTQLISPEEAERRSRRRRKKRKKPKYIEKLVRYNTLSLIFVILLGLVLAYKIVN